jgi:hypothetical protein
MIEFTAKIFPKESIVFRRMYDSRYFKCAGVKEDSICVVNTVTKRPIYISFGKFFSWFGDSLGK